MNLNLRKRIYNNSFIRKFYRSQVGRFLYSLPATIRYFIACRSDLVPPPYKIFIGRGNFEKIGKDFLEYFISYGLLSPDNRVLDVGCGIGRMAIPLISYLSSQAEYHGFDIVKDGIKWCQNKISKKANNFFFTHLDVFNSLYNRKGKISASDVKFPYADKYFDFAFATSVFTHMEPSDIKQYLKEIYRVLKTDGRVFITCNLLNDKSLQNIRKGKSELQFKYPYDEVHLSIASSSYNDIALNEKWLIDLFNELHFELHDPIIYGYWSGRDDGLICQDIIIAYKSRN